MRMEAHCWQDQRPADCRLPMVNNYKGGCIYDNVAREITDYIIGLYHK